MKAGSTAVEIVGRESELEVLRGFADGSTRTLVLSGGPGIGKTTLWEAGVAAARDRGVRVLTARASGAEAQLAFAGLIDLLDGVSGEELGLPVPQLQALEVALLRAEPAAAAPQPGAIGLGLRNALRALAARQPVLVAIDDVQWLDPPSADALVFAARRLEPEIASFLLAKRPGPASTVERALGTGTLQQLEVAPLSFGATRRLLGERLGLNLPRHVLRRLVDATLGNPLFALEVGRVLAADGLPTLSEGLPVPDSVEEALGVRVARLPASSRRLLLALALSGELRKSELVAITTAAAVEDAVDAGLLLLDGPRVRASHPLLAAAARKRSRPRARRELHRELARVVGDGELRARHLALAADSPDEGLAATVARAAAAASARGARQEAAELGEQALRLTPEAAPERSERLLAFAGYLVGAGAPQRATDLLSPEVQSLPTGATRARAWRILAGGAVVSEDDIQRYFTLALAEDHDDAVLRASVLVAMAEHTAVIRVARIGDAESKAVEALADARTVSPEVERVALYALAWARALSGRPIDDVCARFAERSDASVAITRSPERIAGQRLVWRGEVGRARAVLEPLLSAAETRGEAYSYALIRLHLCQLELRIGNWTAAERFLDEWAADEEVLIWPMYQRCRALLAAGRGFPAEAEHWAEETIARATATGNRWDLLEALRARGTGALLAHEPGRAAESLRTVWEHTCREGVDEPGVFPVAPELVEALVETGEVEEARAVASRLRGLAERQEHPWGLTTAKRCDALVGLGSRRDETAAAGLEEVALAYGALGLRFDRGRALLLLGRAQRRHRRWAAARAALEQAAAAFDDLGSPGWADEARSELVRVGARRPTTAGQLTPTEQRVVDLAIEGLSNKEIAQTLVVTVNTVETHLSHAYAKLGVRSRAQLARLRQA